MQRQWVLPAVLARCVLHARRELERAAYRLSRATHALGVAGRDADDAQVVAFTQTLIRKHRVPDAMVEALQARLGDQQLVELTSAIGYYAMAAMTLNTLQAAPAPRAEVLPEPE